MIAIRRYFEADCARRLVIIQSARITKWITFSHFAHRVARAPSRLPPSPLRACTDIYSSWLWPSAQPLPAFGEPANKFLNKTSDGSFRRGAALPAWAQALAEVPPTKRTEPVVLRLQETQVLVGPTPATLVNRAVQVNETSALGVIGQFGITYFSDYQKLTLHRVAILREGQRIDHTATVNARSLQRETLIENGMYGGATTLQLLLDDVRVGDTLWITYTVTGANPVFGKNWADDFSWDLGAPIELRRLTVLHPRERQLNWRQLGEFRTAKIVPQIDHVGDLTRLRFEGRAIEAIEAEPSVPMDYLPSRMLQFSEYQGWQDVARWADSLFPRVAPSPALKALAQQFGKRGERAAQASAALQWVQKEIRYFSVSIGENSHRPQAPAVVLKRRYGDCKDKSYLLVSLLAELGIEARPVLLSANAPKFPAKVMASPSWFDHALVQIRLDGHDYYVDPTTADQPEPLAKLPSAFPGASALVIDPASQGLVTLPERGEPGPKYELVEDIVATDFSGPATLASREIYRGAHADAARRRYPSLTAPEFRKRVLANYEKRYPGVSLIEAPVYHDNVDENRLEVLARFTLPKAVVLKDKVYGIDYDSQLVDGSLGIPDNVVRNYPLALAKGKLQRRYRLNLTWPASVRSDDSPVAKTTDNAFFFAHKEFVFRGNTVNVLMDYRIKDDTVSAASVPVLQEQAKELERFSSGRLLVPGTIVTDPKLKIYSTRDLDSLRTAGALQDAMSEFTDKKDADIKIIPACGFIYGALEQGEFSAANALKMAARLEKLVAADASGSDARICQAHLAFARGDFSRSAALYSADPAPVLEPVALREMAWAMLYAGNADGAVSVMDRSVATNKPDHGFADVMELVDQIALLQRSGRAIPPELLSRAREIPDGPWPRPLMAMQVGAMSPEALIKIAEALPGDAGALALNEAWFYLGQSRLAAGDYTGARAAFAWLNIGGIRSSRIYYQARAELLRMKQDAPRLEAAMRAIRDKDYSAGVAQLRDLAATGNAAAQYGLSMVNFTGQGVPRDSAQALSWLQLAAAQGHMDAQFFLGAIYEEGEGVSKDQVQALRFYRAAAEQGQAKAQVAIARFYMDGKGVDKDAQHALFWYARAMTHGDTDGMYGVGGAFEYGRGVEQDYAQAAHVYRLAAELGHPDSQVNLGLLYQAGNGVKRDDSEAVSLFRKAADAGNMYGQSNLAAAYYAGLGVATDYGQALAWYRKASEQGSTVAMNWIGYIYRNGKGVSRDDAQAASWYRKAAEEGSESAPSYNLAVMYENGEGVDKDPAQALVWYRKAAELGDADAQLYLGDAYAQGKGLKQSYPDARVWYEKAEAQGDARAQLKLANLYFEGNGAPMDRAKAANLFKLAAEQGNTVAQYSFGYCLETGTGIGKDEAAAATWYEKPAAAGLIDARNRLGIMYEDGRGVSRDASRLAKWLDMVETPDLPRVLVSLGSVYASRGNYDKAEQVFLRALAALEKKVGSEHPDLVPTLTELGNANFSAMRYARAEPYYRRALAVMEKTKGPEHLGVAEVLDSLSDLYRAQQRPVLAEQVVLRAMAIREKQLGPDDFAVGDTIDTLALVYVEQDRFELAEQQYMRALSIIEKARGPTHSDTAIRLGHLAMLYYKTGKYAESERLYQRVLAIFEAHYGTGHQRVIATRNNLAAVYDVTGRHTEAQALFQAGLVYAETVKGLDHHTVATALNNLGQSFLRQGNLVKAEPLFERALAIREQALGAGHVDVAYTVNSLGVLRSKQGRLEDAETLLTRALAIRERELGPDTSLVAETLNDLGGAYVALGRHAKAEQFYLRALTIRRKLLAPGHPDLATSILNAAELYRKTGRANKAAELEKTAMAGQ
ncbi:MAG: tetratricopeptide repeat protein [Telluria sp.]|nr:tetratricopeptide repeat protein [Telluria sp.]